VKKLTSYNLLRIIALIVLFVGAIGSLVLLFNSGRDQKSIVLIVLFTGWVLSPFIGLFIADMISKRWLPKTRITIYLLIIFITLASLLFYSGALNVPGTKPAFKFLMVPLISWVLMLIFVPIKRKRVNESSGKN
jgi:peptidoglycan/LPS O-acetylase OafA/YrhL